MRQSVRTLGDALKLTLNGHELRDLNVSADGWEVFRFTTLHEEPTPTVEEGSWVSATVSAGVLSRGRVCYFKSAHLH